MSNIAQKMMEDYSVMIDESANEAMKMQNPDYDAKIQKILNKLISEEMLAYEFYTACLVACNREDRCRLQSLFNTIALDELNDHASALKQYAEQYGYDVPFKHKDYEKHASKLSVSSIDKLKKNVDIAKYVEDAIASEKDAIASYDEAIQYENVPYELNTILLKNQFDEKEHLEKLETFMLGCQANVNMYIQ